MSTKRSRDRIVQHQVVILVFDGAQMLDIAGPADSFSIANAFTLDRQYTVVTASPKGGAVRLSNGLALMTKAATDIEPNSVGTLIVAGAERDGLLNAISDARLKSWMAKVAKTASRVSSVCVGSFALAAWGLLNIRRATSHWSVVDLLQSNFPLITVDKNAIFVVDGKYWTAGGVTTGIDMALAMIEADSSKLVAGQVAGMLVMAARRLGNQAQYSSGLKGQTGRYAILIDWMMSNLTERMDIVSLAERAKESERSFCRKFVAEVGQSPAQFVELLRLDAAKRALQGGVSAKAAAKVSGFTSPEHMARVFRKNLDMSPIEYRSQNA